MLYEGLEKCFVSGISKETAKLALTLDLRNPASAFAQLNALEEKRQAKREEELRKQVKVGAAVDFGFIPLDLLQGRTHFEGRDEQDRLVKVDIGLQEEHRVAMARVACGAGALAAVVLLFRAFVKETQ